MSQPFPHDTYVVDPMASGWARRILRPGATGLWLGLLLFIAGEVGARLLTGSPIGSLERLFLSGPLLCMPMVLYLSRPPDDMPLSVRVWSAGCQLYWIAAIALFLGVMLAQIPVVGQANALLWSLYTWTLAFVGLACLAEAPRLSSQAIMRAAPFLFLPVGGFWFAAWSFNVRPMGFDMLIVLLTAIHFHIAGLVVPALLTVPFIWCRRQGVEVNWEEPLIAGAALLGIPMVAAGIAAYRPLELVGALLLGGALAGNAVFVLRTVVPHLNRRVAKLLVCISALTPLFTMPLSVLYSIGRVRGSEWISVPTMVLYHGLPNVVGFALCGLVGWTMITVREADDDGRPLGIG